MTDEYSSMYLDVPSRYHPTKRERFLVRSKVLQWNRVTHPVLEVDLTVAGSNLFQQVAHHSYMGSIPFEIWVFGQGAIQIFQFDTPPHVFALGALCGMPGVDQVAVMGPIIKRERGSSQSMAHVYLEDQEGRWWFGVQALKEDGSVVFDEPAVSKLRSDGKPLGVGGWFALSRRLGLRATVSSVD